MSTLAYRPPRGRRRVDLSVTPLIDVLFLLIIFFMLTGTFKRVGELELRLPDSTTAEAQPTELEEGPIELVVTEDGRLFLDQTALSKEDLASSLREARAERPDRGLVIQAESEVSHGRIVRLLDAVRRAGFPGVGIGARIPATVLPPEEPESPR